MAVEVFVQGLRVVEVAGVGVDTVEQSIIGIVVSCSEIVLPERAVVLLAGVQILRLGAVGGVGRGA